MSEELQGDERYAITETNIIRKLDTNMKVDIYGNEYHIVQELGDGYIVYMVTQDPSQPNPNYFIHKRYVVNHKENM